MKPERWQQLNNLFLSALAREPQERSAFLDEACAADDSLRKEVEALLAAHEEAGSFIENPAFVVEAQALANEHAKQKDTSIVGQAISHYRIIQRLGVGGMGEVYLAQDLTLGRQVALKLLPPHFIEDAERLRRFEQEARAASALNHPNILTIYEVGYSDSARYIATEFIDGVTLRDRMAGKPMKPGEVVDVGLQVASALAAAHARGIVHRDIKPENVMISSSAHLAQTKSYVKVLDFGIAKLTAPHILDTEMPTRPLVSTSQGITMGTAPYMSPEQVRGERVDARSDIWSLGAVLYEMLAGQRAFVGEKSQDINASILRDEPPSLAAEVPEGLKWLVKKALRKDREDRYQTAREMFSDLVDLSQQDMESEEMERSVSSKPSYRRVIAESGQASVTLGQEETISGESAARTTSISEYVISRIKTHKLWAASALMTLLIVTAGIAFGLYEFISRNQPRSSIPFETLAVSKLTVTGNARAAGVSPDGKYLVYVVDGAEQQSIRVRHISTSSDMQIIPPAEAQFFVGFSPDGAYIHYLKRNKNELIYVLYQVAMLGGISKKIIEDISSFAFSPDGKQLAFVRLTGKEDSYLMIANADGSGVRTLATHKAPSSFIDDAPVWSPDAKAIFCAVRNRDGNDSYASVVRIRMADGVEETFTSKRWGGIQGLARLRDRGLIVAASQIWVLLYPDGEAQKITDDTTNYAGVSASEDARRLVAIQSGGQLFNIWIKSPDGGGSLRQLTSAVGNNGGATWTPDGKILYTSNASGNLDIWIMDQDGGNRRQLTVNAGNNYYTSLTADGRYIVFVSNRSGRPNVWRMNYDGSNPKQLTNSGGEPWPYCSPDGKWVVYQSAGPKPSLWRVPVEGGDPVQLTDKYAGSPSVSSDGKLIACVYFEEATSPANLAIIPIEGGPPVKLFDLPATLDATRGGVLRWAADDSSVTYVDTRSGVSNIWSQPLAGGPPKQVTDFNSERIAFFNWSRDGKQLALTRGSSIRDVVLISDSRHQQ